MAYRQYVIPIDDISYVAVELKTVRGQVVSFVVRLMFRSPKNETCVVRYDTAHGQAHLDRVNDRGKLIKKEWLLEMGFADALCYAIEDLKLNHETYIIQFQKQSRDQA